jgi:MotA/TolQ/ExbB proton channel family
MDWSRAIACDDLAPGALAEEYRPPLWRLLVEFCRALTRDDPIAHRYLLLLRFILANVIALALIGAAVGQGWVGAILAADQGGLCRAIVAVFVVGLVWSGQRALQLSRGLNELERFVKIPGAPAPAYLDAVAGRGADSRGILASSLRLKLASRITPIRHIANSLVLLGLIGTVVGFIIALSGVRPEVVSDVGAIGPMVSTLISGMSVALYTTLVGSLLNVWLMVNVRLLEGGTVKLLTATVELGERDARS